jgi:hypothetical protein
MQPLFNNQITLKIQYSAVNTNLVTTKYNEQDVDTRK